MSNFTHCSGCCINAGMHRARDRRERIATAVLAGHVACNGFGADGNWPTIATLSVKLADALIAALDATPAEEA